jgi:RimJ/RimL family protein N-acetyltransferase
MSGNLTIRTPRLLLRPMQDADAAPLFALFADWEVIRRLSMPPWPYRLDDAKSFIAGQLNQDLTGTSFAITRDGVLIGGIDVRLNKPGHSQSGPGPNLGYWLGRPHWGCGYMTEAARGFLAHVFAAGAGDTIYSGAFADNATSLRVQDKLGFVRESECMLYAKPRNERFPHVNTALARKRFEQA